MQYRSFGSINWKVSALGFGMMRLPTIDEDTAHIDEDKASQMVYCAIEAGLNYIDTAYPYHKEQSERFIGRILNNGYREKVKLATKMPSWLIESVEDFDRYFDKQLERLQTDHIDFYLLHALNKKHWEKLHGLGVLKWAEKAKSDGRISHLGFSFHDDLSVFKNIIDSYDRWTFCQIQYNYMDINYQAGTQGLKYAADKGLAVVIMEPLRGGQLAIEPPESVAACWSNAPAIRTPADWALQWLWNQPEVSVVLSGMSTLQQVEENIASADASGIDRLTDSELATVGQVRKAYEDLAPVPCTGCKYCLPCPNGVNIPRIFALYNQAKMYNDLNHARKLYNNLKQEQKADNCIACGECEEACPQGIKISQELEKAHNLLTTDAR